MQLHDEVAKAKSLITRGSIRDTRKNMEQANQSMTHVAKALTILSQCVVVAPYHSARPDSRIASQLIEAQTYLQQFLLKPDDAVSMRRANNALLALDLMLESMDVYEFPLIPKTISRRLHPGGMVRAAGATSTSSTTSGRAIVITRPSGGPQTISGFAGGKVWVDEIGSFVPDEDL